MEIIIIYLHFFYFYFADPQNPFLAKIWCSLCWKMMVFFVLQIAPNGINVNEVEKNQN